MVAIGYRRSADDRLEQDPDGRVREALSLVFRKFSEIGSVRQLALWLRQEGIDLPIAVHGRQGRTVQWRPPRYNTVHRLLTNPVYAGAYVFGRTGSRARLDGGRKVITHGVARRREEWGVLIRDHHDGYMSWEEYDRNQKIIAGNANMKGTMVAGSVRRAEGFSLDCSVAGTADASSRYCTMRGAILVISAMPKWTTPATRSASRSAICASMRRCRRKCCVRSRRWLLRRRCS